MISKLASCVSLASITLVACVEQGDGATRDRAAPCTIAEVAGIAITDADARVIATLLRPPPTTEQARRLVVAAAAAACEVDCTELTAVVRPHSSWLRHYRASGGGRSNTGGSNGEPSRAPRVQWASGPDACDIGQAHRDNELASGNHGAKGG